MMPSFLEAADAALMLWSDHYLLFLLPACALVILAWRLAFLSGLKVRQRDARQNAQIAADVARARMQLVVRQSNYRDKGVA